MNTRIAISFTAPKTTKTAVRSRRDELCAGGAGAGPCASGVAAGACAAGHLLVVDGM